MATVIAPPVVFLCRACEKQAYLPPGHPDPEKFTYSVCCPMCGSWQWTRDTCDGVDPRKR